MIRCGGTDLDVFSFVDLIPISTTCSHIGTLIHLVYHFGGLLKVESHRAMRVCLRH